VQALQRPKTLSEPMVPWRVRHHGAAPTGHGDLHALARVACQQGGAAQAAQVRDIAYKLAWPVPFARRTSPATRPNSSGPEPLPEPFMKPICGCAESAIV